MVGCIAPSENFTFVFETYGFRRAMWTTFHAHLIFTHNNFFIYMPHQLCVKTARVRSQNTDQPRTWKRRTSQACEAATALHANTTQSQRMSYCKYYSIRAVNTVSQYESFVSIPKRNANASSPHRNNAHLPFFHRSKQYTLGKKCFEFFWRYWMSLRMENN